MHSNLFVKLWYYLLYWVKHQTSSKKIWLWCLMPLSTIFLIYHAWRSIAWVENRSPWKKPDLTQVTDNFYHIMLYWIHLAWTWFELATLVVMRIDCTDSCKFNNHTITTSIPPSKLAVLEATMPISWTQALKDYSN